MSDRIVLLGTGTCQLELPRMASSVLIELDALRLVFDFGRGVSQRLVELGLSQDDVRHIVLSHYHPDHFSDLLAYLWAALYSQTDPRSEDLHLWGPNGLPGVFAHLSGLLGEERLERQDRFQVVLHEVEPGRLSIEGREFELFSLPPAGNQGLRFLSGTTTCALTGDSHFHDELIDFLRDVDLAVIDSGHLTDQEIVQVTVASRARTLVCSHLYRDLDPGTLHRLAAERGYSGRLLVGVDLQVFELAGTPAAR